MIQNSRKAKKLKGWGWKQKELDLRVRIEDQFPNPTTEQLTNKNENRVYSAYN